jgi:hypothetical protein
MKINFAQVLKNAQYREIENVADAVVLTDGELEAVQGACGGGFGHGSCGHDGGFGYGNWGRDGGFDHDGGFGYVNEHEHKHCGCGCHSLISLHVGGHC